MYSKPRFFYKYLRHLLIASNGKGHGIHSPFVYDFIRHVMQGEAHAEWFPRIEALRKKWKNDRHMISFADLGGKGNGVRRSETISGLARRTLSTPKFGRLLFRLARHYECRQLLELGSALGISGSYLIAGAGAEANLISIEGAAEVAELAAESFSRLGLHNTRVITGNFDDVLPGILGQDMTPDLVYIDGNHRKKPLLAYFNAVLDQRRAPRVVILHDIHWSTEMESGWQHICSLPEVMLSMDLFFAGLVFFDDRFRIKQHFRIRF